MSVSVTCPVCGFTLKTPFGEEDAKLHLKLHTEQHHNNDKVARARISKTELIRLQ
ncbi:MAG: hypothetical protein ACQCN4_11170 [Candidatus Bathyarchaeia archaeon]|jgi:hypothetical protein